MESIFRLAECTFEDPNLCGWTNIHGDNFDWTRSSGSTVSLGTGPSADHTYGTNQGTVSTHAHTHTHLHPVSKLPHT